jgi:hypothetical protein
MPAGDRTLDTHREYVSFQCHAAAQRKWPRPKIRYTGGARMKSTITPEAFDALITQTGLPLSAEQKAALLAVYPTFQEMIARVTQPLPRETEPGLIFLPEVR